MKMKLSYKIFLAFLATSILSVVLMVATMRFYVFLNFADYVNRSVLDRLGALSSELAEEYLASSGWSRLSADPEAWDALVQSALSQAELDRGTSAAARRPRAVRAPTRLQRLARGLALFDADRQMVAGGQTDRVPDHYSLQEITAEGKSVGWLGLHKRQPMADPLVLAFFRNQSTAFYLVGAGIIVLAALASFLLSRHFLAPVRRLADGTRSLAGLNFHTRLDVNTRDELGQLAADFNRTAQTLQTYETMRRQWISDISHELRTPMAVLRGEVEALQDGVREVSPAALASLHAEVVRLSRLVDDLHHLSVADSQCLLMHKESVLPLQILAETAARFRSRFERQGIALRLELPAGDSVRIPGDAERLTQLFSNLFENSLGYTDAPGSLVVSAGGTPRGLFVRFEDTEPGVPAESLERLFDRLYRVDPSRSRNRGGSGLGLAICKQIVASHGGTIAATAAAAGGLQITIELPLTEEPA